MKRPAQPEEIAPAYVFLASPQCSSYITGEILPTAQATRILVASAAKGEVSADDKAYLAKLVAARTGLSEADATKRVDTVIAGLDDARNKAKAAADSARKASATFALVGALSMIVGAFIASVAAALGGQQRDEDEALFVRG